MTVSRSLVPIKSHTALLYEPPSEEGVFHVAPPARVAARLAMRFPFDPELGQFFTLVYGVLDTESGEFRYVCAGHPPPICLHADGRVTVRQSQDPPVGVSGIRFEEHVLQLCPGDRVFLYSDGVTETRGPNGVYFGRQRFVDALRENRGRPLHESIDTVMEGLKRFRSGGPPQDDVSLVAIEVREGSGFSSEAAPGE